jgi:hypothetical protein
MFTDCISILIIVYIITVHAEWAWGIKNTNRVVVQKHDSNNSALETTSAWENNNEIGVETGNAGVWSSFILLGTGSND